MTDAEILALADRLFTAIEAGDLDGIAACWADDVVVWTNFGGAGDRAGSLKVLRWLIARMPDLRYEVSRREVIEGGFLQQHVLHGTAPDGSAVEMPACIVATAGATPSGPRITRIDEYLDPAATAALVGTR